MADNQEQLFNEFADLAALEAQQKKILDIFEKVKTGILDLNKSGIKIDSASGQRGLGDALKNQKKQQDELTLSINEYNKLLSQKATLEAKLAAGASNEAKTLADLTEKRRQSNKELKEEAKINNTLTGSLENIRAKRLALISKRDKIQIIGPESLKQIEELNRRINNFDQIIKRNSSTVEQFKQNVGNYAGSLSGLFEGVRREIARLERAKADFQITGDTRGAEAAARQIQELDGFMKISYNTSGTLNTRLKELNAGFVGLAASGNVSEEFLNQLKKDLGDVNDKVGDIKESLKLAASDTRLLDIFIDGAQAIAGGFALAQGTAALFGQENEEVQKTLVKLTAVMNILNGLQAIQSTLKKQDNILTVTQIGLQKAYALVVGNSTGAIKFFRIALASLATVGIAAVVVGIIEAVKYFDLLGSSVDITERRIKSLQLTFQGFDNVLKAQLERLKTNTDLELANAKKRGATEKELQAIKEKGSEREKNAIEEIVKSRINEYNNNKLRIGDEIKSIDQLVTKLNSLKSLRASEDDDTDLAKKQDANINSLEQILALTQQINTINNGSSVDRANFEADQSQRIREELKKRLEDEKKAALELLKLREEINIEIKSAQADDNLGVSLRNRLLAANESAESQKKIIIAEKNFELDQEKLTKSQIKLINEKAANDIRKVELDLAKKIIQIRIEEVQKTKELVDDGTNFYAEISARNIQALEKSQNELAIIRDQDLKSLTENYRKELELAGDNERQREKAATKFNDRKLEIELGYQAEILRIQIEFYKKQLDLSNLSEAEKLVVKSQLAKAEADLADLITNRKIANDDKEKKSSREKYVEFAKDLEKFRDIYTQVMDVIGSAIDAITTAQLNAIQAQLDAVDKLKAAEIDRITKSTDSEEKKAARIKIVEARAQSDREALERRQRQVKRQQAIFDKANNIANIILNTAEAVTKWLAKGNIGLSIAAGVIGAAQLAIAIATPIPQFAKGKKAGEYEGYGIVGEAGREIAIDEKGKVSMYEKPTLTYLSRGTTILPNQVTEDILNANNLALAAAFKYDGRVKQDSLNNHMIEKYEEQIRILKRIEEKQMTVVTNIHNDANWNSYIEQHVKR